MSESVPLQPAVLDRVRAIGSVDLLIGIPSYNNAKSIAHVVRAAVAGCAKYFPDRRAVIVNSDGGSSDGTPGVVAEADVSSLGAILVEHRLNPVHRILTPYHGIPGKGSAFRTIFALAERLGARACAVVDSDLRSITPEWFELLLGPILLDRCDFVAPLYLRHKYDGTITNSIVYPLTRSLYGKEVRQPIGGDFGFSGRLAAHYLSKPVWDTMVARFGIDIWMTTTAIADGYRVAQAFLGAKIHDAKDPGADLASMFVQVIGSVFDLMGTYQRRWLQVDRAEEVTLFGFPHGVGLEPVPVNVDRMLRIFRQGRRDLAEIWIGALRPETEAAVAAIAASAEGPFHFPDPVWVDVVHDFALSYRGRRFPADQLLGALVPLYLGRTASFVLATAEAEADQVESLIRGLADTFLSRKSDLAARWSRAGRQEA